MIKARLFDFKKDYVIYGKWWKQYKSLPPPQEYLSETGIIVEVSEKPVCAGFVYKTDSKICIFEFYVSDRKAPKKDRYDALNCMIAEVQNIARLYKYSVIYTSINIKAYNKKLKSAGFVEVSKNQTHMFCFIE